jgi:quercetin dioxygenase-like cupin family protein
VKSFNSIFRGLVIVGALSWSVAFGAGMPDAQGFVIVQQDELDWGPDLTKIKTIALQGDPNAAGFYIIRIRFPAGNSSRPHSHDQDRFITVIQGTWYAGRSSKYDMADTIAIKAGGFMKHPAGAVHFDGAKDEAVIVEIRGMGPVKTTSAAQASNRD